MKQFECFLDEVVATLNHSVAQNVVDSASVFERDVRAAINDLGGFEGRTVAMSVKAQVFPDIELAPFGIEVKHTTNDTWRSVANSISEGNRDPKVEHIFVIFGKMGGMPEVRWARYDDCVMHVRTSHVPRFELEIGTETPIFSKFGIEYSAFSQLDMQEKMTYVRSYAKSRLKTGERLWWLPDIEDRSLPAEIRLFKNLTESEKKRLRAEATFVSPKVFVPGNSGKRAHSKFDDALMYLLIQHGVYNPSGRDIFTAGSAHQNSFVRERDGSAINRATVLIWDEIQAVAEDMSEAMLREFWDVDRVPEDRIGYWLSCIDEINPDFPLRRLLP